MNKTFDYNGVQIAPSRPVQKLRTVKKTLFIDSGDRDIVKYPLNGDFIIHLPRVYEKVVSLNISSAEFPPMNSAFAKAINGSTGTSVTSSPLYFLLEFKDLNKADETAHLANRSSLVDSAFAKFQVHTLVDPLFYNENSSQKNIEYYQPSLSKLDRLHIRTRLHTQKGSTTDSLTTDGFIYWDTEFALTLEIETLENSFDDFSSIETRVGERAYSGFFQR